MSFLTIQEHIAREIEDLILAVDVNRARTDPRDKVAQSLLDGMAWGLRKGAQVSRETPLFDYVKQVGDRIYLPGMVLVREPDGRYATEFDALAVTGPEADHAG